MKRTIEKLRDMAEVRDPMLRMQRLLTEKALAEAVGKMDIMKGDQGEKGDTGEDGYSPVKGKDYFTTEEIDAIINYLQSQVKNGEKGDKGDVGDTPMRGVDYWTLKDQEKIIAQTLKKIPKNKEILPEEIVALVLKEIKIPNIEGLISKNEFTDFLRKGGFRGGGDTVAAGTGISLAKNSFGQTVITNTASGSGTVTSVTSADANATVATTTTTPVITIVSAPKLQTARTIDGVSFDGSANITVVAPATHAATTKATPVDADEIPLSDSAASFVLKKLTWANLKATMKVYTDTLYPAGSGTSTGTNTGDQTSIVGITGTMAQFDTAVTDGNIVYQGQALGTPSSGVATNITGLPAASVLAGTLGTGAYVMDTKLTVPQVANTPNAITASGNAATVPITYRTSNVTNNSAATLTITMTTTSATDGLMVMVRIYDFSAVAQTLVFVNTENSTVSVPSTSNGSTTLPLTVGFQYNSLTSKWRCIASA